MNTSNRIISFIIPAFNEEKNIANTIASINRHVPPNITYEIIVIDHISSDNTKKLAEENGAVVLTKSAKTVAELRNYGAAYSSGEIFIFLDADVRLTEQWNHHITNVIERINSGEKLLTGSWVSVPDNKKWIEKYWFEPQQRKTNTHINSGHMILSRQIFSDLGGFNGKLETGEDYDISMRAKQQKINVIENHNLKVIHEGYPRTLIDFIKREYWHGKGDALSLGIMLKSKVALLALLILTLHIIMLLDIIFLKNYILIIICIITITSICILSSFTKFKNETKKIILINAALYYVYFLARGASLLNALFTKKIKKRQR